MRVRPVLIRSEDQLIGLLRGRREALGLSQAELDDLVGWAPAYTSKVEAPHRRYGRRLFIFLTGLADEWLEALGLGLVLMDRKDAEALTSADAPAISDARAMAYAKRSRDGGVIYERRARITLSFRKAG